MPRPAASVVAARLAQNGASVNSSGTAPVAAWMASASAATPGGPSVSPAGRWRGSPAPVVMNTVLPGPRCCRIWRPARAYWSSETLIGRSSMRQPGIGRLEVLAHDVGQELHAGHRGLAVEPV